MEKITEYCTGCRACEQLCGHKAIEFKQDKEGFWEPTINQSLCVDCGLCALRCPQNAKPQLSFPIQTLALRLKNDNILYKSASGGAFAGFAFHAIQNNWSVFGVKYDLDLVVHHASANCEKDIYPLLGSKYVQSDTRHTFMEVKTLLRQGKKVLYSGTACQIAGLKSYLGKDKDNLLTMDIVCHGVPSPLLFQRYLGALSEELGGSQIEDFDFRDKKIGWGVDYKYRYRYKGKNYFRSCSVNAYYMYFLKGNICRECCYLCPYANKERIADITIADYWGIEYIHPKFDDERGVSLMLINTPKGMRAWGEVKEFFDFIISDIDEAAKYNTNLIHPTPRNSSIRDHVYDDIWDLGAVEFMRTRLPLKLSLRTRIKLLLPKFLLSIARNYMK